MDTKYSIARQQADNHNYKAHSKDGVHFLVDTSAAPEGRYYGFIVIADAVVASITHIDSSKNGDVTALTTIPAGMYITQPGLFSTLTLTSGEIMLLKTT